MARPVPEPADPTPRPLACLSIDVANAFNSVDRAAVLRAVYGTPELAQCWRMVAFGYGRPSWLLMPCGDGVVDDDAFVKSSNGVRQGDPLAALLFALAVHVVYERVARICRKGCFAYSDDSHGVGWLEECWRAWEAWSKTAAVAQRLDPFAPGHGLRQALQQRRRRARRRAAQPPDVHVRRDIGE